MSTKKDTAADFYDRAKQKAPEYVDLFTAESEEEFEAAFNKILELAITHLEKNKKNYATLQEEGLTAALAGALMIPGLRVTQEANSNGHVDIIIEADHCAPLRTKLGEAKIYSGPAYHMKGIGQLLGRYSTGRETQGLLINYVKSANIKAVTANLKAEMDKQLPEKQVGPAHFHSLKWSLVTKHLHSSGEELLLSHVGCNLYLSTDDKNNVD